MSNSEARPPDLWNSRIEGKEATQGPVQGAMAPYTGTQYSVEEIWRYYCLYNDVYPDEEALLHPLAMRIRAFDVPALRDLTFTVTRLSDVAPTLQTLLAKRLPDIACEFDDTFTIGRIQKYGIIHEVVSAPPDEATGELMVLEIYGRLTHVNGEPVGVHWYRGLRPSGITDGEDAMLGELTFRVERATYANTRTPGIGVPSYM